MARILVIGGAGYIGSHCCKALAKAGYTPVVYDNLSTGHRTFARWGEFIEGDIRDETRLSSLLSSIKPAGVMHFAGLALVGDSVRDPGSYYDVNVVGTLRILNAMRDSGVSRLVFSSTCAVYGDPAAIPISEESECNPVNPYGATKLACERMMDDFGQAHQIRSVRLRYFNAAGADSDGEIGEWHDPETHLIPLIFDAALQRRQTIRVFGTDYDTPDGTAVRDYVHVEDLASAHVASLQHLLDGGSTEVINLGTGAGVSVSEAIAAAEEITGLKVPREHAPRRAGDPPCLVADPSKAQALLGWRAQRNIYETVKDAWEWHWRLNS